MARIKQTMAGGARGFRALTIVAVLGLVAAFAAYNFFTFRVGPNEQGVVLRLGSYDRDAPPGLNWRLPYPIETVYTPEVTTVHQLTVGQSVDQRPGGGPDIPAEGRMVTRDQKSVDLDFTVFWRIGDPRAYVVNAADPVAITRAAAVNAMREVVGQSTIADLATQPREVTESRVATLLQAALDKGRTGIRIAQVQLLKVDAPAGLGG